MAALQWTVSAPRPAPKPLRQGLVAAPVHIETHGYLLRSMVPADITERVVGWVNHDSMLTGLNLDALGFTVERMRAFVSSFDGLHNHLIGIFDASSRLMVGFYTLDVGIAHRTAGITCGIGEEAYKGRRVLWATIDALLDHFFTYREIDKITARVLARNVHMLFNFVDNTRFVWEARLRRECLGVNGERLDVLVFAAHRDGSREDGTAP